MATPTLKDTKKIKSTKELFDERNMYAASVIQASSDNDYKPYATFLDHEFLFYGKVSPNYFTRSIMTRYLKPIKSDLSPLRLVGPIADAAADFIKEYQNAYVSNKINKKEKYLSAIKPVKAYTSFYDFYNPYIQNIFNIFTKKYIPIVVDRYDGIVKLEQFVEAFVEFNLSLEKITLMPSKFIISRLCDPFVSGIMFSIADISPTDDPAKYQEFINSKNSSFYRKLALKYGFSINYNMPWTLVADLGSPALQPYLSKYMTDTSVNGFFNTFYTYTYLDDLDTFKNNIVNYYNSFVKANPRYYKGYSTECGIKSSKTYRIRARSSELDEKYGDEYWVDLYARLKIMELQEDFIEEPKKNAIRNKAIDILHSLDLQSALYYVIIELQKYLPLRRGTMHDTQQRRLATEIKTSTTQPTELETPSASTVIVGGTVVSSGY